MAKYQQQLLLHASQELSDQSNWFSDAIERLGIKETPDWPDSFGDKLRAMHSTKEQKIRVLSLFSGAGGLDIGFHDAGFHIVECNELEKVFAATLRENSKKGRRLEGANVACTDIRNYHPTNSSIDFIIGGPPCQTFSAAGARAAGVNGTDDERGNLFLEYARILKVIKPSGFLFENVYRIIGAQGGKPWRAIQDTFANLGYTLHWRILDSADYGVPQFRERVIIVGLRTGSFHFPYPSHGPDSLDTRPYYTAGQALASLTPPQKAFILGGRHGHLLTDIPPGLNYSYYTEKLGHPTPIFAWRSKFSDYLYKADPQTPVRTIKAQGGQYTGPFHWESRPFTLEELKRLQTFPDSYQMAGARQKVIHQLGNSVPPQLGRILALSILDQVFHHPIPFSFDYMPDSFRLGFRKRKRLLSKVYSRKAAIAIASIPDACPIINELRQHSQRVSILGNLQLVEAASGEDFDYIIHVAPSATALELRLEEPQKKTNPIVYRITISPDCNNQQATPLSAISMSSTSSEPRAVLALWKYLESLIGRYYHKDDLVQFFGYYQYRKDYSIQFDLRNAPESLTSFWKVLPQVTSGRGVGDIFKSCELSDFLGLTNDDFLSSLVQLKDIGYEVRNHNTNSQIKPGMILIPYAFPTLNARSLQRLTEL